MTDKRRSLLIPPSLQHSERSPQLTPLPLITRSDTVETTASTSEGDEQASMSKTTTINKKQSAVREYSDNEIEDLLSVGYIRVHCELWEHIPVGSHVRYIRKDDGTGQSQGYRFRPGGFIKGHLINTKGEKMMAIASRINGAKNIPGYFKYTLTYDSIETLWKKYDRAAFVEIHLIYNSLAMKKRQIDDLLARVTKLEAVLARSSTARR